MANESPAGYTALLNLNEKVLTLINTVKAYKDNKKALKICVKLVKTDAAYVKQSYYSVTSDARHEVLWRYNELLTAAKNLSSSDINVAGKAAKDLDVIAAKTEEEIAKIKQAQHPIKANAQKITDAVTDVAQKLKQSVGKTVSGKFDELKKKFAAAANSAADSTAATDADETEE